MNATTCHHLSRLERWVISGAPQAMPVLSAVVRSTEMPCGDLGSWLCICRICAHVGCDSSHFYILQFYTFHCVVGGPVSPGAMPLAVARACRRSYSQFKQRGANGKNIAVMSMPTRRYYFSGPGSPLIVSVWRRVLCTVRVTERRTWERQVYRVPSTFIHLQGVDCCVSR